MESDKKLEMIREAIRNLMEDEEINADTSSSNESLVAAPENDKDDEKAGRRRQLLLKLLSELESLEQDKNGSGESGELKNRAEEVGNSSNEEEIIKELRNVKRQNSITHHLLTALIVITLAWQLSEVSLILRIKDGLSNPLKSVGGIVGGFFRKAPELQKQVPELPHLDLPALDSADDEDDS